MPSAAKRSRDRSRVRSRTRLAVRLAARFAARLAAVQALYQRDMEKVPVPQLLQEFHRHRLGATIEDIEYGKADVDFFDDLVSGVAAREAELDAAIAARLTAEWSLDRLDRPMRQILRAGAYELAARIDVTTANVIDAYVDVTKAFCGRREAAFVHGILDAVAKDVRR
jgi:transcription antitermination protein NusB